MRRVAVIVLAAVGLGALAFCQSPTQITIIVTTDIACDQHPESTITVGDLVAIETKPAAASTTRCDASGRVASLVIVPSGSGSAEVAVKVVEAIGGSAEGCKAPDYRGCIVSRRALHFIPHESLEVDIALRRICKDVPCLANETCVLGNCVAATIADSSRCEVGCDERVLAPGGGDGGAPSDAAPDAPFADASSDGGGGDSGPACSVGCDPSLAAVTAATCALVAGGAAKCWGLNGSGELGRGNTGAGTPTPDFVARLDGGVGLSADNFTTCARRADQSVQCWGYSDALADALDAGPTTPTPTIVPQMAGALEIAVGGLTICWRAASGVRCIGNNDFGQLGIGDALPHTDARAPLLPSGAVSLVRSGREHHCAMMAVDGSLYCWGSNATLQVDPNEITGLSVTTPRKLDLSAFGSPISDVRLGRGHGCALLADTTVVCWGNDTDGQAGKNPPEIAGVTPRRVRLEGNVADLSGATSLALGDSHTCATVAGGKVKCWGSNTRGQLGRGGGAPDGASDPHALAGDVLTLDSVTTLAAGSEHMCAVRGAGAEVWCWGRNDDGEVGVDTVTQTAPRRVY